MKTQFSTRMAKLRRKKGLSQRQAAAALGISQALLSHYENGAREPKFEFVSQACKFYEVTADYLLGISNEQKHNTGTLSVRMCEIISLLKELSDAECELLGELNKLVNGNNDE